jgi:hypothetical protein
VEYTLPIKDARLVATRDQLNGGTLELLSDIGVVSRHRLDDVSGVVLGGLLVFAGFPKISAAEADGVLTSARIVRSDGLLACKNMSVAQAPDAADVVMETVSVKKGNLVRIISAEIRHA